MNPKRKIQRHYERRITPGRENFDVLDWCSAQSQRARFEVLVREVDLAGKSLLDVGCGLGDLLTFLERRRIGVDYTGVDLLERMVDLARRQHPGGRFFCADLFAKPPAGEEAAGQPAAMKQLLDARFDVVFSSGTFNLNLGNARQFLPRALARMLELARRHVVFNLLHVRARPRFSHCAYHEPREVLQILAQLPCRARIIDDYLPNDFTVVCERTISG